MIYFTSWRAPKGTSLHGCLRVGTERGWFTGFAVFPSLLSCPVNIVGWVFLLHHYECKHSLSSHLLILE